MAAWAVEFINQNRCLFDNHLIHTVFFVVLLLTLVHLEEVVVCIR